MNAFFRKIRNLSLAGLMVILILAFASSCKYDEVLPREVEIPIDSVSFAVDIQPIFDANCLNCHSGTISPNLETGNSYNELINNNLINTEVPENSILYNEVNLGGHAEGYVTLEERTLILVWIQQGGNNN